MSIRKSQPVASRVRGTEPSASGIAALCVAVVAVFLGLAQGPALAAANPALWNQASSSGLPAGSQIYDTINLSSGVNPTGTLSFKLFGPDNSTCAGTPIFTTTTAVNGNGYYESSRVVVNYAANYTWMAVYGGDAANNASAWTPCDAPSAQVTMGKRTPLLAVSRSWAQPTTSATGVLSGGSGPSGPTGTMTYKLFGPDNMTCAGAPAFSSVRQVSGNGTYVSGSFNPSTVGTYEWVVSYSGDANNFARSSICSDTTYGFTVGTAAPATAVSGTPTTVARGGTITVNWSGIVAPTSHDWVALYPVGTADGGAVTAWKYTTGTANGSVTLKFPWGATAGSYEIRLMANNNIQRLATSGPITLVW